MRTLEGYLHTSKIRRRQKSAHCYQELDLIRTIIGEYVISLWKAALAPVLLSVVTLFGSIEPAYAQRVAKYGADFLAGGVGARALGMGGAYVAIAQDVTSGYWNPAGLSFIQYPEAAYMHAERFAGIVSFDYGSVAFPLNSRSTFGVSLVRSGVDDIPNTLDAWDSERDRPRPNPDSHISRFSAADYAFYLSYARLVSRDFRVGINGKIVRRGIGEFAIAWGYSMDVAVQYRVGPLFLGANIQDTFTMLQSWSVNGELLQGIADFGDAVPQGGTELVLPVARLGTGYFLHLGPTDILLGLDVDLAFDGQQAYAYNLGDMSFHPRIGSEISYRDAVALRFGLSDFTPTRNYGTHVTPSVGAGLNISRLSVDYGFGDFSGMASELGFSHRISLKLTLAQERFSRPE